MTSALLEQRLRDQIRFHFEIDKLKNVFRQNVLSDPTAERAKPADLGAKKEPNERD